MKALQPPNHFSDKTCGLWKAITSEFDLAPEALELLRVGLENLDLGDAARETLRREGSVIADAKGILRKHPACDVLKLCDGLFLRALRQLGLDLVQPGEVYAKRKVG